MVRRQLTILASILGLTCLASASSSIIQVMGQSVAASDIQYYLDSGKIASFVLDKPAVFTFTLGNTFKVTEIAFLDEAGNISMVASSTDQKINWKMTDGRTVQLDCSRHDNPITGIANRLVKFVDLNYSQGCDVIAPLPFKWGQSEITVTGELDVDSQFRLLYAQKVTSGKVQIGPKSVTLDGGSEIAFYSEGQVRFFTPASDESFTVRHALYGELQFKQNSRNPTFFSFFENGQIEKGLLANDLVVNELNFILPRGSGVIFSEDNRISTLLFAQPIEFKALNYTILMSQWHGDSQTKIYSLKVARDFLFTPPNSDKPRTVPVDSVVDLDESLEIVNIMIPAQAPN